MAALSGREQKKAVHFYSDKTDVTLDALESFPALQFIQSKKA